jgi:hypothetical protein
VPTKVAQPLQDLAPTGTYRIKRVIYPTLTTANPADKAGNPAILGGF